MAKPLEGLLVIELATYWVGPSAGAYLRAQGARVIKIEQPPYGDSTRFFARTCGVPYTDAENPIHDVSNGGKECITLDLKDEENIKLLHRMLAKADVFLTSVRQAGLERLGLDYDSISGTPTIGVSRRSRNALRRSSRRDCRSCVSPHFPAPVLSSASNEARAATTPVIGTQMTPRRTVNWRTTTTNALALHLHRSRP